MLPLLDLRSPAEYAKGHIPGAINLPLLDNDERAEIGTLYKQEGKVPAVQRGLDMFALRASDFELRIREIAPNKQLKVHCWRGGLRSGIIGKWLSGMGYKVEVLPGGYKAYRTRVLEQIEKLSHHKIVVLHGLTGAGKTELLTLLAQKNLPIIDLEGLASHRGSAFGSMAQENAAPTQQQFENDLAAAYTRFEKAPCIAIEIESQLGSIHVNTNLRQNLQSSPIVVLERTRAKRAIAIEQIYGKNWNQTSEDTFMEGLNKLKRYLSNPIRANIEDKIKNKQLREGFELLLEHRYDAAYAKSMKQYEPRIAARFETSGDMQKVAADFAEQFLT